MSMNTRTTTQLSLKSVAIIGLGYVGLPTALALHNCCRRIIGVDVSQNRLDEIAAHRADLSEPDKVILTKALTDGAFEMTTTLGTMSQADAVIICVPTPVTSDNTPDLTLLRSACARAVSYARPGQTLILTSTTFVGATAELLAAPLEARGMRVGTDVFVAFSPERIDPGNPDHLQRVTPRVVGGTTVRCTAEATRVLSQIADVVHPLSSPEVAEAAKYENIQRAITLALANEFADACRVFDLDPVEVTNAAATKPYSFIAVNPGPGVGGHCIPVDPHYLLWQLHQHDRSSPLMEQAMTLIDKRPGQVVVRAREVLAEDIHAGRCEDPRGRGQLQARRPGRAPVVSHPAHRRTDLRRSRCQLSRPADPSLRLADSTMTSTPDPHGQNYDLVIIHTMHPGAGNAWAGDCPRVLDATYHFVGSQRRVV